jgi:ribosomal protein L11 methylase PrmA
MDLHHEIVLQLLGELHKAPIARNPQRILDVGTGTGIWAIYMADKYPSAEGIDTQASFNSKTFKLNGCHRSRPTPRVRRNRDAIVMYRREGVYLCSYADDLIPEALQKWDHAKAMFHIA